MKPSRRSKIRAPQADQHFVVSPIDSLESLIQGNRQRCHNPADTSVSGLTETQLVQRRQDARRQLVVAAVEYGTTYADSNCLPSVTSDVVQVPVLLSGHQPEFFHPGVWFKNFLLAKLGRVCGGISINLIIDNDVCTTRSLAVPTGTLDQPNRKSIAFDSFDDALTGGSRLSAVLNAPRFIPYEMTDWQDSELTVEFPTKVKQALASLMPGDLILDQLWGQLVETQQDFKNLGMTIASVRHRFELEHEVRNLEVPLSHLCKQNSFRQFLSDILIHAESFHQLYNDALTEFRRVNKVRSESHPVPKLVVSGDWLEIPFWIWSAESPWRGPLYIRRQEDRFQLSDLDQIEVEFQLDRICHELENLEERGIAIRPRALMTTLFARVFLADLFVHGIGGAKYDELTDRLMHRFYGIEPPQFLTATSTHLLPLGISPFDASKVAQSKQQIRNLHFHPERFIASEQMTEEISRWIAEKQELLSDVPPHGQKKSWHQQMEQVNRKLRSPVEPQLQELQQQRSKLQKQRQKANLLASREYSFLLHPPTLVDVLHEISDQASGKFV